MLRQTTFERFDKELRKHSKADKDHVNEMFAEDTNKLYNQIVADFKKQSAELILEGSGWGE
jgi:urate oxidase